MREHFLRMERLGAIVVCLLAVVFHFTYRWSGKSFFVGLISATNESVWEHTKIIYFPYLFYSIFEFFMIKPDFRRFLAAKAVALAFISIITITFFYTYTGIVGQEYLAVDIICTFVWVILAFFISHHLYFSRYRLEVYAPYFIILFCAQLATQVLFTPFPPNIPLFQDPVTGTLGF